MGRTAKAKGLDVETMASQIKYEELRKLFLSGANGEPRPRVRPVQPSPS
jgi:hypothetical protein